MSNLMRDVFHIVEKASEGEEPAKSIWTKIGVAFVNRDQSLNVLLDMLPLNGKIHIRERKFIKNKPPNNQGESHE